MEWKYIIVRLTFLIENDILADSAFFATGFLSISLTDNAWELIHFSSNTLFPGVFAGFHEVFGTLNAFTLEPFLVLKSKSIITQGASGIDVIVFGFLDDGPFSISHTTIALT